ncbi:hypothetical protein ACFX1X_000997 [Malus domestica]
MTCYLSWDGNESEPPSSPRSPAAPTNRPSLVWPQPMAILFVEVPPMLIVSVTKSSSILKRYSSPKPSSSEDDISLAFSPWFLLASSSFLGQGG